MRRTKGVSDGGGGDDGGDSCWSRPAKVNLALRRHTPSWDSAFLSSSSRLVKAVKNGEDSKGNERDDGGE